MIKYFVVFLVVFSLFSINDVFAQQVKDCTFGGIMTPLSEKFAKDLAVREFVNQNHNVTKNIIPDDHDSSRNLLVLYAENNEIIETLELQFDTDEKECYIPVEYHYTYSNGIIAFTVTNTIGNFTEIMNLIKSDNITIDDLYPENCKFVTLEYNISHGKVYGICKERNSVIALVDAYSDGTFEVTIPIKTLYSLPSTNCIPTGDFFVMDNTGESDYDISQSDNENRVKIELDGGFHRIQILGSVILPSPSPAQYCGIVEGYDKPYLSPFHQIEHGMNPTSIKCNEGLVLIQKYDESPACVKHDTKIKLIAREWTTLEKHLNKSEFKITGLDRYYHPNEPLSISVAKTGYDMCDDWSAKVIDYSDNSTVWQRESHTLCVSSEPPKIQDFIYPVTNENNPLIISKSGDYLFQIDIGGVHLEKDIVIRQNMSGISFDRTVYSEYCNKTFEDNEIVKYSSFGLAPSRMVFFVNQNSTAHICIKYTSNLDNEGTLNLEAEQKDWSLSFYNGTASKIPVSVTPSLISLQNGALTVVDYSIMIPPDERGVYWLNVSQRCERIPIVTSDYPLSSEDIPAIVGAHGCPMIQLDAELVSYSGAIVQYHDAKPMSGR